MEDMTVRTPGPLENLFTGPSKWCKQFFARTADGFPIGAKDPKATQFCLLGALEHCFATAPTATQISWNRLSDYVSKTNLTIGRWNDAPERTFADVQVLIQELNL